MALNPAAGAADIAITYQDAAGIDATGNPTGAEPAGDFPADFADAYNAYAMDGVVPGAQNNGGDASIIEGALRAITSVPASVTDLATALANYWATVAVDPGDPAHGGTAVASVENNAATLIPAFTAAITASITSAEDKPWYGSFVSNVQTMAVTQIIWTVTELMPPAGTPVAFPEAIT